ncbi:MAG: DUF433 domain-containing protein [Nitrospinae bacterium]|nr:DUF433 domain-containing protein [Nitrospinota bacterium]
MDWRERIVGDQKVLAGKPVIKGTRISVELVIDLLANGWTREQILRNYPHLSAEDIAACLHYAHDVVKDIKESNYDLVIFGSLGLGAIKDSQLGTVCDRVVRRIRTDTLVVRYLPEIHEKRSSSGKIVVAVDGSAQSFGGVKSAIEMAKYLNRPLEIISTFDPYFHYAMFNSLTGVLSKDAAKVFKFEQQEKLHEDIIDKGLAKIYQSHLEISRKMVEEEGLTCTTRLLDGKVFEKVLQYCREENPYMLILGRIGVHSDQDMDIGGNTENLLRLAPCNVYLSSRVYTPPVDMQAEESISWTDEAKERLKRIPGFVRPMATTAILRSALERGHSLITSGVITEAVEKILPAGAMQAMYNIGDQMRDKIAQGKDPLEGMIEDRQAGLEAKYAEELKKQELTLKCSKCGAIMDGDVVKCGVCDAGAEMLVPIDKSEFKPDADEEKDVKTITTFDFVEVNWTQDALDKLNDYPLGHIRNKARARVEKNARIQKVAAISVAFLDKILNEKSNGKKTEGDGNGLHGGSQSDEITWAPEATARMDLIPAGFMRDSTRDKVLDYAKSNNISHIDLDIAEKGIEESKKIMADAVANGATLEDFLPKK